MTSLRYEITVCASGRDAAPGAATDAGLAAAAGGGAAVATALFAGAADDAPCDPVAGLCANPGALAIVNAIANTPAVRSCGTDGIEMMYRGRIAMSSGPNRRAKHKPYQYWVQGSPLPKEV